MTYTHYSDLGYTVSITCPICGHTGNGIWFPNDDDGSWDEPCECGGHPLIKHDEFHDTIQDLLYQAWRDR